MTKGDDRIGTKPKKFLVEINHKNMIEIYKKTVKDPRLKEIDNIEVGSWISVISPGKKEIKFLAEKLGLDMTIMEDALDENEISRVERSIDKFYMIIRFPTRDSSGVKTLPLLVVITEENIVTLCKIENEIVNMFKNEKVVFYTTQKTHFLLQILLEVFRNYDLYLNRIMKDIKVKKIGIRNLENKDILFLVQEEETLTDFESSLFPIIGILERILSGRYIAIYERDKDVIEDLVMDSKQTLELSRTGLKLIKNIREAYSTILTNELNRVIKVLTAVTIILTIPTIISSIYGMNIPLPLEDNPSAFLYVIIIIFLTSLAFLVILIKRRWI